MFLHILIVIYNSMHPVCSGDCNSERTRGKRVCQIELACVAGARKEEGRGIRSKREKRAQSAREGGPLLRAALALKLA